MTKQEIYNAIKAANNGLPTIPIKGKDYVMVKDRLRAFREQFPDWSIITEIVSMDADQATIKATIMDPDGRTFATGHAQEVVGSNNINRTSHLENAETGALGRALAAMNIGIDDSFGSADEVANAALQQSFITEREFKNLAALCKAHDKDLAWLLATAGAASGREITPVGYAEVVKAIDRLGQEANNGN